MFGQTLGVSSPTRKEGRSPYQCASTNTFIFRSIDPTFTQPHSCICLSVGTRIIPNIFSSNCKWREISQTHFVYLSHDSQPLQDLGKGVTIYDHTCLYVHWFMWRAFWTSVVSSDWINNTTSTVNLIGNGIVNVLCQLYSGTFVTQSRYLLLNVIFQSDSKPLISGHIFIWIFSLLASFFLSFFWRAGITPEVWPSV